MPNTAGKIMPIPRGEYASIAIYSILDMVRYNNCLWIAKKNNLKGVIPSNANADSWMLAFEETNIDVLESKVAILEQQIVNASSLQIVIGDSEPTDCNVLWYNTNYQNNITESTETVMLDIGEVTDETVLSIQVNDEDYSITNTEDPQQVDDETYQFIINY